MKKYDRAAGYGFGTTLSWIGVLLSLMIIFSPSNSAITNIIACIISIGILSVGITVIALVLMREEK